MSQALKTLVAALTVGSSLLFASAARADSSVALLAEPPVAVTACQVDHQNSPQTTYNYVAIPTVTAVDLSFQNRRQVEADEVDFQVGYDGQETTIVDKGRFAPLTTVAQSFNSFSGSAYSAAAPDHCRVAAVHYVDGSTWHANSGAPVAQVPATHK